MNTYIKKILAIAVTFLSFAQLTTCAQADISNISIKFGVIRNHQRALGENGYDLYNAYPEIELGGNFFLDNIKWGCSIGYWNDNISEELFRDHISFTDKAVVITPKLYYNFLDSTSGGLISTSLFAGISYQIKSSSPLTPYNIYGDEVNDYTSNILEPLIGSQIGFYISTNFMLAGEVAYHLMSRNANNVHQVEAKVLLNYLIK